ncbi:TPA: glycosyltransferase, partial [Pasteurella multocida]|nr:glycosyltransferase [Pasteurella multocida]
PKQNNIIFLGRIESVKRGWLFCEIAKKCPEYNFYMLGQTFSDVERNSKIMEKYKNIHNLHFPGHVDGEEKNQYLKDAKILINTSIHEALPVSFLEALSYGTLLVSNQNPEDLTSQFGIHVGTVLGDGFEHVDKYVNAVKALMENDEHRKDLAQQGIKYIKEVHNLPRFIEQI